MKPNIYACYTNRNTHNFGGYEIIIDGEAGRANYPGRWDEGDAKVHYWERKPWNVPTAHIRTYIVCLNGAYYALGLDMFATTVYALGPDRTANSPGAIYAEKLGESRDDAIRAICQPHDRKTARNIAEHNGIYCGQLIPGC